MSKGTMEHKVIAVPQREASTAAEQAHDLVKVLDNEDGADDWTVEAIVRDDNETQVILQRPRQKDVDEMSTTELVHLARGSNGDPVPQD